MTSSDVTVPDQVNAIHALGEQIGTKLARAEELGAEGSVEESLKLMEEVEALKKQKSEAEVCYASCSVFSATETCSLSRRSTAIFTNLVFLLSQSRLLAALLQ